MDKALEITTYLMESRDLAKRLYGADYDRIIKPWRDAIQNLQAKNPKEPIAAICKRFIELIDSHDSGVRNEANMLCATAAACEEMSVPR